MNRICVFAGTAEGRELIEFLCSQGVAVTACVATEYGEALLSPADNLTVSSRRLTEGEMEALFGAGRFDLVIDATHPYASAVTENIVSACSGTGTEYLRLLRSAASAPDDGVFVPDIPAAVAYLNAGDGNILLTTGSKELSRFTPIRDFENRVYARVLPLEDSLGLCRSAGVKSSHILALQGPFSREMNVAMLKSVAAKYLVTKDSGSPGGFQEKRSAAREAGARLVVIGRPPQGDGLSLSETISLLCRRFGLIWKPRVWVVGIGPGSRETMTLEARDAIGKAECVIGAKRMVEAVAEEGQFVYEAIAPEAIASFLREHRQFRRFAVVMSGDVGFFSGAKKLLPLLEGWEVTVLPGISSLAYLCARLGTSYEDVMPVSVHGRSHDILPDVRRNSRVFALVGGETGVNDLCRALVDAGLGQVRLSVGQRLSYPDETITRGSALELAGGDFHSLSAVLMENDRPDDVVTPGLPDELFRRGEGENGVIPMTKSEVRAVCLAKLRLTQGSVCWDIGAGTGSVAIEMARLAQKGQVYAVEKDSGAAGLLKQNKARFNLENLTIVSGPAPEVCVGLPVPSHAFVGGSAGHLGDILRLLLEKNPGVRIVATAISLESVAELTAWANTLPFSETEVVCVQVARGKKAGASHLMLGQNPVSIFTMQGGKR